jgi:hypothetical protein
MVAIVYSNPITSYTSNTDCKSSTSSSVVSGEDCSYIYYGFTFPTATGTGDVLVTTNLTRVDGTAVVTADADTTCAVSSDSSVRKRFSATCNNVKVPGGKFSLIILEVPACKAEAVP